MSNMRRGDTAQQFSQRSYRNADQFRKKKRSQQLWDKRNQEVDEFDYLHLYPQDIKKAIINSLAAQIPIQLPPVGPTTISLYRRAGKAIFQTRPTGSKELDPHMTHQSLHILSMAKEHDYPNFAALTKEFQRDLKLYLSASNDIHTMALIAAGNHIIGKEKDILTIAEGNISDIWILFNHILSNKISYEALLPFVIKGSEVAFRALYEFSNTTGHESIAWFFDKEEVVDSLLNGLESKDVEIKRLALRIFGNILGEEVEHYANTLLKSNFLNSLFKFLMSSDPVFRKDGCWVLANFCSYECAATIVLYKQLIMEKLVEMLYYETSLDIRKELAHIFNYLISLAQKILVFQKIASPDFFLIMASYLQLADAELSIIVCNIVFGLLSVGENFKNENEQNQVVLMVKKTQQLTNEISKGLESENCMISEICQNIHGMLNKMEEQL